MCKDKLLPQREHVRRGHSTGEKFTHSSAHGKQTTLASPGTIFRWANQVRTPIMVVATATVTLHTRHGHTQGLTWNKRTTSDAHALAGWISRVRCQDLGPSNRAGLIRWHRCQDLGPCHRWQHYGKGIWHRSQILCHRVVSWSGGSVECFQLVPRPHISHGGGRLHIIVLHLDVVAVCPGAGGTRWLSQWHPVLINVLNRYRGAERYP